MPNPIQIPEEYNVLFRRYNSDECTDEERLEIEAKLFELSDSFEAIIDDLSIGYDECEMSIIGAEGLIEKYKARIERQKARQARIDKLTNLLMNRMGKRSLVTEISNIGYRKSSSVVLDPGFIILAQWERIVPAKSEPDKTKIKKLIQAGTVVPGARIIESNNLQRG